MKYVIMADGKGNRWSNYLGTPKHLASIEGEKIIARTVRLLNQIIDDDDSVVVTSHNKDYEFEGANRYEPIDNQLEIDRFTNELIARDVCFLYGDTFYTEDALNRIHEEPTEDVVFFGNHKSIVGVKIKAPDVFRYHIQKIKNMYIDGKIKVCKGWQVYASLTNQCCNREIEIKEKFVEIHDITTDINTPEEYEKVREQI